MTETTFANVNPAYVHVEPTEDVVEEDVVEAAEPDVVEVEAEPIVEEAEPEPEPEEPTLLVEEEVDEAADEE